MFFIAVAGYGSLVPFRYTPLDFSVAIEQAREILGRPVGIRFRTDFISNVLVMMPIGYCLMAAISTDRQRSLLTHLSIPLVVAACASVSVALEFSQLWFSGRVSGLHDVIAQVVGAVAGICLALVIGQTVTDWIRSYTVSQPPKQQMDWLLQAYFVGFLVCAVLPLDLTISPAELVHKYRQGAITLVPFADFTPDLAGFLGFFLDAAVFVPVGMLAATWMAASRKSATERAVRPVGDAVVLGAIVVAAVELVQLAVLSRTTSTTHVIAGTLGVWAGAWMMWRFRGDGPTCRADSASRILAQKVWLWLGLAAVYSLFLLVVFCAPFDTTDDVQEIKARFDGFLQVPFSAYQENAPLHGAAQVLRKGSHFAPLGALLAMAAASLPIPQPIRRILAGILLLAAMGVATAIEMVQVFLPPHVPNSTDVILCVAGAAAGMFVTFRLIDAHRPAPHA